MPVNYRFDPFTNTLQPATKTDERWTIPSISQFWIKLLEVPKKDTPSTLTMRVVSSLSAAIATTGATTCLVDDPNWFSVSNVLTIDSEKVNVTAKSGGSAATTLNGAISSTTATSVVVTSGAALAVGQIIKVDTENMKITNIATNTLTVTRGYNGTTAATHSTGASCYIQNSLTITRGYSSTTATTHLISTSVYIEGSMSEVSATPSAGQFWPDYSTSADNDPNWNTGTILFNSADAGKVVSVNYNGIGSLADDRTITKGIVFDTPGTYQWTAPYTGYILVDAAGGGGGSGGAYNSEVPPTYGGGGGGAKTVVNKKISVVANTTYNLTVGSGGAVQTVGGTTSFGALLSCPGGGAGAYSSNGYGANGASGGEGGRPGINGNTGMQTCGDTLMGVGGVIRSYNSSGNGNPGTGYGAGASGAVAYANGGSGSGAAGTGGIIVIKLLQ